MDEPQLSQSVPNADAAHRGDKKQSGWSESTSPRTVAADDPPTSCNILKSGNFGGEGETAFMGQEQRFVRSQRSFYAVLTDDIIANQRLELNEKFCGIHGITSFGYASLHIIGQTPSRVLVEGGLDGRAWFTEGFNEFVTRFKVTPSSLLTFTTLGGSDFGVTIFDPSRVEKNYDFLRRSEERVMTKFLSKRRVKKARKVKADAVSRAVQCKPLTAAEESTLLATAKSKKFIFDFKIPSSGIHPKISTENAPAFSRIQMEDWSFRYKKKVTAVRIWGDKGNDFAKFGRGWSKFVKANRLHPDQKLLAYPDPQSHTLFLKKSSHNTA